MDCSSHTFLSSLLRMTLLYNSELKRTSFSLYRWLSNPFLKAVNAEWLSTPSLGLQSGRPGVLLSVPKGLLSPGYVPRGGKLYMREKEVPPNEKWNAGHQLKRGEGEHITKNQSNKNFFKMQCIFNFFPSWTGSGDAVGILSVVRQI